MVPSLYTRASCWPPSLTDRESPTTVRLSGRLVPPSFQITSPVVLLILNTASRCRRETMRSFPTASTEFRWTRS
jgi:hypothetical protein